MKKLFLLFLLAALFIYACDNDTNDKGNTNNVDLHSDDKTHGVAEHEEQTSDYKTNDPVGENLPHMQPENAVKALISAAQQNNMKEIESLCDVEAFKQKNSVCNASGNSAILNKLKTAKIKGDIKIKGTIAHIPVEYETGDVEMVKLVLRNDIWKISSVENLNINQQ